MKKYTPKNIFPQDGEVDKLTVDFTGSYWAQYIGSYHRECYRNVFIKYLRTVNDPGIVFSLSLLNFKK